MKKLSALMIVFMLFGLSGCATSTTLYKEELYPKLRNCRSKSCLQSYGLVKLNSYTNQQGQRVETYHLPAKQHDAAYTARQVGHGVMSFATLGLWEIAYYPIEDSLEL